MAQKRRPFGVIALIQWMLAVACSGIDATLAYDRVKVLLFTGGLLMIDIASAVLFTLMWFLDRTYLEPAAEREIVASYAYRAGHRDGVEDATHHHELRLVTPRAPQRPDRGYFAASQDQGQVDDFVS